MLRRTFFLSSLAGVAQRLRAANPALKLGYDTYSIRAWGLKALDHLDFASKHGLNAIQISSLDDLESLEPAHLEKVKRRAAELGILIDGGTGCICPTAKAWRASLGDPVENIVKGLKAAHGMGARSLRCYLGDTVDRYDGKGIEYHMASTIKVFKAARAVALDLGVKIALENHSGDMQAWELKTIIEESGKDAVAACLDTGNPIWCVEHPETTLEVLAPYTVTTHYRDTALFEHPRGCAAQWTACGDGSVDLKRLSQLHKQLCPQAPLHLEIITGRPPRIVPYLEESFWKGFPKARAEEFARFVSLVKKGSPLMAPMVMEDAAGAARLPEFTEALKQQQKLDLERSFDYAKGNMI